MKSFKHCQTMSAINEGQAFNAIEEKITWQYRHDVAMKLVENNIKNYFRSMLFNIEEKQDL